MRLFIVVLLLIGLVSAGTIQKKDQDDVKRGFFDKLLKKLEELKDKIRDHFDSGERSGEPWFSGEHSGFGPHRGFSGDHSGYGPHSGDGSGFGPHSGERPEFSGEMPEFGKPHKPQPGGGGGDGGGRPRPNRQNPPPSDEEPNDPPERPESGDNSGDRPPPPRPGGFGQGDAMRDLVDVLRKIADELDPRGRGDNQDGEAPPPPAGEGQQQNQAAGGQGQEQQQQQQQPSRRRFGGKSGNPKSPGRHEHSGSGDGPLREHFSGFPEFSGHPDFSGERPFFSGERPFFSGERPFFSGGQHPDSDKGPKPQQGPNGKPGGGAGGGGGPGGKRPMKSLDKIEDELVKLLEDLGH